MQDDRAFLGVGWGFPLEFESDGSLRTASYDEDVRQAICIILGTNYGERMMRPDFGGGLRDFLFAPMSTTTRERIRTRVREALIDWEPRIELDDVLVSETVERNRLDIEVRYRVRETNALGNLVYPFYLEEGAT